jgi:hypothetical protein
MARAVALPAYHERDGPGDAPRPALGRYLAGALGGPAAGGRGAGLGRAARLRGRRPVLRHGPRPRRGPARGRALEYEAYEARSCPAGEGGARGRCRWPVVGRIALLHRVGVLAVGESARGRRGLGPAPARGVRRRPLLHRLAQALCADLEARRRGRAAAAGASRRSTSSDAGSWVIREPGRIPPARGGDHRSVGCLVLYLPEPHADVATSRRRQLPPGDAAPCAPRRRGPARRWWRR